MNILRKIATPFVAIWRWIKETAWVQPLLIVGIIFAIIFSIPSITKGIQGLINQSDSDLAYFEDNELSMEGTRIGEWNSEVDNFFANFEDAQTSWANGDKETAKELLSEYSNGNDRFFLFFVQDSCDGCGNLKTGLEYLNDNWDTYMPETDSKGVEVPPMSFVSIVPNREFDDDTYYSDNNLSETQRKAILNMCYWVVTNLENINIAIYHQKVNDDMSFNTSARYEVNYEPDSSKGEGWYRGYYTSDNTTIGYFNSDNYQISFT